MTDMAAAAEVVAATMVADITGKVERNTERPANDSYPCLTKL
jgi:hypothetical protein